MSNDLALYGIALSVTALAMSLFFQGCGLIFVKPEKKQKLGITALAAAGTLLFFATCIFVGVFSFTNDLLRLGYILIVLMIGIPMFRLTSRFLDRGDQSNARKPWWMGFTLIAIIVVFIFCPLLYREWDQINRTIETPQPTTTVPATTTAPASPNITIPASPNSKITINIQIISETSDNSSVHP